MDLSETYQGLSSFWRTIAPIIIAHVAAALSAGAVGIAAQDRDCHCAARVLSFTAARVGIEVGKPRRSGRAQGGRDVVPGH